MIRTNISSLIALLALTGAAVTAGVVNADVKAKPTADKLATLAKTDTPVSARDTSNLRCWQYGELLFEQTHLAEKKLASTDDMLVFKGNAKGDEREIYLINAGSATCLFEKI